MCTQLKILPEVQQVTSATTSACLNLLNKNNLFFYEQFLYSSKGFFVLCGSCVSHPSLKSIYFWRDTEHLENGFQCD